MVEKLKNYLQGIGSVLVIFPEERDLSVSTPIASCQNTAFQRDIEAMGGDFQRAFKNEVAHGEKNGIKIKSR